MNRSIIVWTGLVKGIERDNTLLDMIITAGSPSETWKMLFRTVGDESRKLSEYKVKKESEEQTSE